MGILPLLFTVFIDSVGFGLVFPIFSAMIMDVDGGVVSPEMTLALRGLLFGFLICAYGIGQFFGGPLLGGLSDSLGRKKVLVGSMWVAFISYFSAGFGVIIHSLSILLIARFFAGVSAGSFSVAQSVISDVSTKESRTKNFALVGMAFWVGFVVGPFLGGKLAAYGYTVPFGIAALLCLSNAVLLLFSLKESFPKEKPAKIRWFVGLSHLSKAFKVPSLRGLFTVMFVFCLGWGFFTEFSPIFLIQKLQFSIEQIANFYAWLGLWIALSQGVLIRPLLKRVSPEKLLRFGLIGMGLILPGVLFLNSLLKLFFIIPCIAFAQALTFPAAASLASGLAPPEEQGEILGIHNSVQWAAISIPPLFSGSLVALFPHLPISLSSICMILSFFILRRFNLSPQEEQNNLE